MSAVINLEKPEKKALRNQFGETLVALGAENPNIVVLDADLACSTQTQLFGNAYPERFFNQGVEIVGGTPQETAAFVKSEIAITARIIKEAGIRTDR